MRLLWVQALVMWFEARAGLGPESQERIRAALERLEI